MKILQLRTDGLSDLLRVSGDLAGGMHLVRGALPHQIQRQRLDKYYNTMDTREIGKDTYSHGIVSLAVH